MIMRFKRSSSNLKSILSISSWFGPEISNLLVKTKIYRCLPSSLMFGEAEKNSLMASSIALIKLDGLGD